MSGRAFVALCVVVLSAAVVVTSALPGTGDERSALYRVCPDGERAELANGVVRYCGPATARLSVFRGVQFRNGTCNWYSVGPQNAPALSVHMGSRSSNARTNNGLQYMHLFLVVSPRPHLHDAAVIGYSKGKVWQGVITSRPTGNQRAGRFVAQGTMGSRGRMTGSYSCPTWDVG